MPIFGIHVGVSMIFMGAIGFAPAAVGAQTHVRRGADAKEVVFYRLAANAGMSARE